MDERQRIALRATAEVKPGNVINLGIGIPTLMLRYLPQIGPVMVHSENGIVGMGAHCARDDVDWNLIDAGGGYVGVERGAAFCDSVLSFALVRGGRLDLAFLGALEMSAQGDLANWIIPGKHAPGIGGGMELAQKARRLVITTTHTTRSGRPKILNSCTLPLTAKGCIDRIITDLAVIDVTEAGLELKEVAEGATVEDIVARTEAPLIIPPGELPTF